MVTSLNALSRVSPGTIQLLQDYGLYCAPGPNTAGTSTSVAPQEKPLKIHLLLKVKRFTGKHSPLIFILEDGHEAIQAVPCWRQRKDKTAVITRAKQSVKTNSVICLENYDVVPRYLVGKVDSEGRHQTNLIKYTVLKKDIGDADVVLWRTNIG